MDASAINSEVRWCDWPPTTRRAVEVNGDSKLSQPKPRKVKTADISDNPGLLAMHLKHGANTDGRNCGDCALLYVHRTKKHPRSIGSLLNVYHCKRHVKERSHVMYQTWALKWPACGKFQERADA